MTRSRNKEVKLLRHVVRYHLTHCPRYLELPSRVVVSLASGAHWILICQLWFTSQRVMQLSSSAAKRLILPSHFSSEKCSVKVESWTMLVRTAEVRPERQDIPPSMCAVALISKFQRSRYAMLRKSQKFGCAGRSRLEKRRY